MTRMIWVFTGHKKKIFVGSVELRLKWQDKPYLMWWYWFGDVKSLLHIGHTHIDVQISAGGKSGIYSFNTLLHMQNAWKECYIVIVIYLLRLILLWIFQRNSHKQAIGPFTTYALFFLILSFGDLASSPARHQGYPWHQPIEGIIIYSQPAL